MTGRYNSTDRLSAIIADDYKVLQVLSRFGLSLGFGDKTVGEVCAENNVDVPTFLTIVNFVTGNEAEFENVSVSQIAAYLRNAHTYFLDYMLPEIRSKLLSAVDCSASNEVAFLILKFFDEYTNEVAIHMQFENENVFGYVDKLLEGRYEGGFSITQFAHDHSRTDHEGMDGKLNELKKIIIRYCPKSDNNNKLNSVLFDIFSCEEDLESHCLVEDKIFIPAVKKLEEKVKLLPKPEIAHESLLIEEKNVLSIREKDIIVCVAKGMINKEIADALCISVNTVITHRRNIARKLEIHTPAGLTIYAIVNNFINISDVKI